MKRATKLLWLTSDRNGTDGHDNEYDVKSWVKHMRNVDGSTGAKWTMEQVEPFRMKHAPAMEKEGFWAAMNMMHSDYSAVAIAFSVDNPEFYASMARAFLADPDGGADKLQRYMSM